jgi:hypothetical protein
VLPYLLGNQTICVQVLWLKKLSSWALNESFRASVQHQRAVIHSTNCSVTSLVPAADIAIWEEAEWSESPHMVQS